MLTTDYVKEQVQRKVEALIEDGCIDNIEPFSENLMRMIISAGPAGYSHERYLRAIEEGVLAAKGNDNGKQRALILSLRGSRRALNTFVPTFERMLNRENSAAAEAVRSALFLSRNSVYGGRSWTSRL